MVSTVAIFKMNFTRSKAAAKAHIRYIQHRPGKTAEHTQHHHRSFFCCRQFAENCDILGMSPTLDLALSPDYCRYHSRYCETFTSYYRDALYARVGEKFPQQDNVLTNQPATDESKVAPVKGSGKERITRTLFGIDGAMDRKDAYRMVDEAEGGSSFFRMIISPDPKTEDTKRDLFLRDVTEQTMQTVAERVHKHVQWVAAEHDDHTPKRHVHVLAVVQGRLTPRDLQAVRQGTTEACVQQRAELDLMQEIRERQRGEAEWVRSV